MTPLLQSFEERALELSAYFKFIELIEKESATLSLPKKQTWKVRKVDEKILRILKANFFLLLYNVVEASIREGFLSVYRAVEADGCSVKQLTPALQEALGRRRICASLGRVRQPGLVQEYRSKACSGRCGRHQSVAGSEGAEVRREPRCGKNSRSLRCTRRFPQDRPANTRRREAPACKEPPKRSGPWRTLFRRVRARPFRC